MTLAQLHTVPDDTLKWVLVVLFSLLGIAATIVSIFVSLRKRTITVEPNPIEVRKSPKRYNHDQSETRHGEVVRRLDSHDAEIEKLWETMREEDALIKAEAAKAFTRISRSLGRIEGKMGISSDDGGDQI